MLAIGGSAASRLDGQADRQPARSGQAGKIAGGKQTFCPGRMPGFELSAIHAVPLRRSLPEGIALPTRWRDARRVLFLGSTENRGDRNGLPSVAVFCRIPAYSV